MPSFIKDKSGVFFIVFSHEAKRIWRSLGTKDKREAYRRFLEEQDHEPNKKALSLLQAKKEYLSFVGTNLSPKTLETYQKTFVHLERHFGNHRVEGITTREIELYKSSRAERVSGQTVNHELRMIRAFFNKLIDWKMIRENPCSKVRDIRVVETTRPYLSSTDLSNLLEYLKDSPLHDVVLFAAMTGMRRGEIVNLSWNDVDVERKAIVVRSNSSFRTKAGKIRTIPMNSTVRQLLEKRSRLSQLVFPGKRGGKMNGNFLRARLKKAFKQCGLDPRLHFHSLRHTFASLLVQNGISLYHVQKLLGHSSSRITEIYAHLGGSELQSSVEALTGLNNVAERKA